MNILSFGDIPRCNEETSFRALLILPLVDTESSLLHNIGQTLGILPNSQERGISDSQTGHKITLSDSQGLFKQMVSRSMSCEP